MQIDEVADVMTLLSGAFPERKLDDKIVKSYWIGLDDIDPARLMAGAKDLLKSARYFPRIRDLRESAMRVVMPVVYSDLMAEFVGVCASLPDGPGVFLDVANQFQRADRGCMAESVKAKAGRMDDDYRKYLVDEYEEFIIH